MCQPVTQVLMKGCAIWYLILRKGRLRLCHVMLSSPQSVQYTLHGSSVSVCKEDLLVTLRSEWRKVARDGATAVAQCIFYVRVLVQFLQNTVLQRGSFAAKSNSWRIAPVLGGKHLVLRNPTSTLWGTHLGPATCWKNVGRVIPTKLGAKHLARLPACTRSRGSGFARIILNPASTWAGPWSRICQSLQEALDRVLKPGHYLSNLNGREYESLTTSRPAPLSSEFKRPSVPVSRTVLGLLVGGLLVALVVVMVLFRCLEIHAGITVFSANMCIRVYVKNVYMHICIHIRCTHLLVY